MASNEDFIKRAFKAGLTEDQVRAALRERNKTQTQPSQPEQTWSQKATSIPILGDILGTLLPSATGLGAAISTPIIEEQTKEKQQQALDLARQAQKETDPSKKKTLLDQSRTLSQEAGEKATNYSNNVSAGVGNFKDMESPTDLMGLLSAYGPQAVRTGVTAGSLLTPAIFGSGLTGVAGGSQALTGNVLKRILGAGIEGGITGGLYGGAREDQATAGERLSSAAGGLAGGAATGAVLQGGIEGVVGLKNLIGKQTGNISNKLRDVYSNTLKRNIKDKNFIKQAGGESKLVDDAIKYNIPTTKNGVQNELTRYGQEFDDIMTREMASAEKAGKTVDIAKAFENAKKKTLASFSHDETLKKTAENWFDANASKYLSQTSAKPSSANSLRQRFDKKVGSMITGDISAAKDKARKMFASELRSAFKEVVGSTGNMAIKKYHLLSGLAEAMMKEPKTGIVELATAGAFPGTGASNILEILGAKAVRSPGLRRMIAKQGIRNIPKLSGQSVPNVVSPGILQLLNVLTQNGNATQ